MIKSMTACGRGIQEKGGDHVVVEVQTVNRRHLDISVHLPRTLSFFDTAIRSAVAKRISRGQVTIRVSAQFQGSAPYKVIPNLALADEIKEAWDILGKRLNTEGFKEEFLIHTPDILSVEFQAEEEVETLILNALNKALDEMDLMKEKEGKAIAKDFRERLDFISDELELLKTESVGSKTIWQEKIEARLKEIMKGEELDERVHKELLLMADKYDVTEEIVRFGSHIEQFKTFLSTKGAYGKTIEFLLQEMGREINTIGSKSQEARMTKHVISVKAELEKLREQVQNVE